jgi:hypothetical protein
LHWRGGRGRGGVIVILAGAAHDGWLIDQVVLSD